MIKIMKGTLLEDGPQLIVHNVNCKGSFFSKDDKKIAKAYGIYREEYEFLCNYCHKSTSSLLGNMTVVIDKDHRDDEKKRFIGAMFTQNNYGDKRGYTDIKAFKKSINTLKVLMLSNNITEAGIIFKMGEDKGTSWTEILMSLQKEFDGEEITLLIYDEKGEIIK